MDTHEHAPGQPGTILPWDSSRKTAVGVARSNLSRVWFTTADGVVTEVFYPRIDTCCVRDLQFLIADGDSFFSEERADTDHHSEWVDCRVPSPQITNTCKREKFRITKEILTSPEHHALLVDTRFERTDDTNLPLSLYALLSPRLNNFASHTTARVIEFKGMRLLVAERDGAALAMVCSTGFNQVSVGYVAASDGYTQLARDKRLVECYRNAEDGCVALTGQVDVESNGGRFLLSVGFGRNVREAALRAHAAIIRPLDRTRRDYHRQWQDWHSGLTSDLTGDPAHARAASISATVLAVHESRDFRGGFIASLSSPWGEIHAEDDLGGYHLVWPRDMCQSATGLLAIGAETEIWRSLEYLAVTQEEDGCWPQNMWLDGTSYWSGLQLDEVASPLLLVDKLIEEEVLDGEKWREFWPMVRKAAIFLLGKGPATDQDRWEEVGGLTPYTLATEVAALLAAAEMAENSDEHDLAVSFRETADSWNTTIDELCYVTGTDLARSMGVDGYYVRVVPVDDAGNPLPPDTPIPITNRAGPDNSATVETLISVDALTLVRLGLRSPNDPKILNTIRVIDKMIRKDLPCGPVWHRYNKDGYGEKEDGSPFDGTGIGRPWPLLTGERAHYEIAAGNIDRARQLLDTFEKLSAQTGLFPEQVWDGDDIPERNLKFGSPTGSARPLAWAHAEYLKLLRSLRDGRVFDMPRQAHTRYLGS